MLGSRLREQRTARGWTQAQLAERAGVSRQLVGALEAGRHLPRVDAAVALAAALGLSVEALFQPAADAPAIGVVAAMGEGQLVRVARVGDRLVCAPAPGGGLGWDLADGVVRDGMLELHGGDQAGAVVVGCEPAIGLAGRLLEADGETGIVAVAASSEAAREALAAGRAHAALVHAPAGLMPSPGVAVRRWQAARWQVGLAAPSDLPRGWAQAALAGRRTVVQREAGAASQSTFERAAAEAGAARKAPGPRATGHLEAATLAVRLHCPAVSIEPAARALGLAFHPLEEHVSELWIAEEHADVTAVRRFADELNGPRVRRRLAAIGGYDLSTSGTAA